MGSRVVFRRWFRSRGFSVVDSLVKRGFSSALFTREDAFKKVAVRFLALSALFGSAASSLRSLRRRPHVCFFCILIAAWCVAC